MNTIWKCKPYYSDKDGHWIIKIDNNYYDINGKISEDYVNNNDYKLIVDNIVLNSAYVSTYTKQSVHYSKYEKTN